MKYWKQSTLILIITFFGIIVGFNACEPNENGTQTEIQVTKTFQIFSPDGKIIFNIEYMGFPTEVKPEYIDYIKSNFDMLFSIFLTSEIYIIDYLLEAKEDRSYTILIEYNAEYYEGIKTLELYTMTLHHQWISNKGFSGFDYTITDFTNFDFTVFYGIRDSIGLWYNYNYSINSTLVYLWYLGNNGVYTGAHQVFGREANSTITLETIQSLGYTYIGHTFVGWSKTLGGDVEYTDGASYTMGDIIFDGLKKRDERLYAVWE